jgi:flagellar hook-associated protein 1 FlgK
VIEDGAPPLNIAGRGFSHFFGLNDIFQGATPLSYDTGLIATSAMNVGSVTDFTLQVRGPSNELIKTAVMNLGSGATVGAFVTALNGPSAVGTYVDYTLDANGRLSYQPKPGYEGVTIRVVVDTPPRVTGGVGLGKLFGMDGGSRIALAAGFTASSALVAQPSLLATSVPQLTGAAINVTASEGGVARALQGFATKTLSFRAAGGLGSATSTFGQYASSILTAAGLAASGAAARVADRTAVQSALQDQQTSTSGVNTDEEMTNLGNYQRAYGACARLITTTRDMYDTLLAMVR